MKFVKKYVSYEDETVLIIYDLKHSILYHNIKHRKDAKLIVFV